MSEVFAQAIPFCDLLPALVGCYVWEYNGAMEIVNFPDSTHTKVGATGICPHCDARSVFNPVSQFIERGKHGYSLIVCAVRCIGCKEFMLVRGSRMTSDGEWQAEAFYPLGTPNQNVDEHIPTQIRDDFKEALRCRFIDSNKGTLVMCRRAVQSSLLEKGASKRKKIGEQIDQIARRGLITEPLQKLAHKVRLAGNEGAHPDKDGLENVTPDDADAIIKFTREYLHHVYVMPALLANYDEPKQQSTTA
jgi:hypothetical protein